MAPMNSGSYEDCLTKQYKVKLGSLGGFLSASEPDRSQSKGRSPNKKTLFAKFYFL